MLTQETGRKGLEMQIIAYTTHRHTHTSTHFNSTKSDLLWGKTEQSVSAFESNPKAKSESKIAASSTA